MDEPKAFASLGASLLARKGGARPAMRPQLQPQHRFGGDHAGDLEDLGWNDMGEEPAAPNPVAALTPSPQFVPEAQSASVPEVRRQQDNLADRLVSPARSPARAPKPAEANDHASKQVLTNAPGMNAAGTNTTDPTKSDRPAKVQALPIRAPEPDPEPEVAQSPVSARQMSPKPTPQTVSVQSKSAPSGRRAAFTLRLDPERHLKLRLASTLHGRSAQQIVTEALDKLLAEMPELSSLARQVKNR